MVWVRERIIPTERPPLVDEVIANFLRIEGATWSAWRIPTSVFSIF
jgi:predicted membrane-bound dolichyl-phosphate-mannose-protein mannosyltransferase